MRIRTCRRTLALLRKLLIASLSLALPLLGGCGPDKPETPSTTTTPLPQSSPGNDKSETTSTPASGFKVALVMSGAKSDNGWNGGASKALDLIKSDLKLSDDNVKSVENQTSDAMQEQSLKDFAARKFNVVIGHGGEYEKKALALESSFPNTLFVISAGTAIGKNTTPIVIRLEDGAYLEGMLAAGMSKTGKIGAVGATEEVSLQRVFAAFEKGAKTAKPGITVVKPVYTNDWENVNLAKQAALALLNQGADVLIQDLDSGAQGVFKAVQDYDAGGKTAYALGTNSDQNAAAPDVILASAPIYIEKAFVPIVEQAKAGTFKPNDKPWGMKEGVIGFVLNPKLESKIPPEVKAKLEAAQKQILAGTLDVTKGAP